MDSTPARRIVRTGQAALVTLDLAQELRRMELLARRAQALRTRQSRRPVARLTARS